MIKNIKVLIDPKGRGIAIQDDNMLYTYPNKLATDYKIENNSVFIRQSPDYWLKLWTKPRQNRKK